MEFTTKNFRLNVAVRVLVISLFAVLIAFVLTTTKWFFTPLFLGLVLISLVVNLIYYVEKTNQELTQFLYNIKQGGFTTLMTSAKSGSPLGKIFNEVIEEFKKVNIEKESHYQYLKTLNENIGVSIISYNDNGDITLMNPAAKTLLKKPYLKKIEELESIDKNLLGVIFSLKSGQREVVKAVINGYVVQLAVQMKRFVMQEEPFNVLLLQNINNELEQKEVEAWQKLISVLTHEIMNSVTPIASLSTAINEQLKDLSHWEALDNEDMQDILMSLKTIENRSKGLIKFVNAYKEFARTPELKLSPTDLIGLVDRIVALLSPDLDRGGIMLVKDYKSKEATLRIDHELIEQVIINLLKNSIEVLENRSSPTIKIEVHKYSAGKVHLIVEDNGPGVSREILDKIFIPFFTTKKKGTGIGLSFSRQVMKLHGGSISVNSEEGNGTSFLLQFN